MKRQLLIVVLALAIPSLAVAQSATAPPASQPKVAVVPFGSNPAAGQTFVHDGVTLYYEVYGQGEPLLIIHGNGGSIGTMAAQIAFFRSHYRVIAMDSRDQGKSGDSAGKITYEKMTDDLAALLDHLKTGPVDVLGWSDGGIEAMLLGIRHPAKVKKIAAMAANLNPSTDAVYPETWAMARSMIDAIPAAEKDTPQGRRAIKVTSMMFEEPNIAPSALQAITAPTLVLAGDHDLIRDEHTLDIFHHIPNSQLAIFPNATHMVPYDDSALFNATVERFFRAPFVKKDRVKDFLASYESLTASLQKK
jgi:pimeloyl-ACP methyl ester carboxylesterase